MSMILVVEDHEDVRIVVGISLAQAGYTVVQAVDAESALRVAGKALPKAIIMDWVLPDSDGLSIALRIRDEIPDLASVPVIFFTALPMESQEKGYLVREFGGFVAKTAGIPTLLEAVATVLAKSVFIVHEDVGTRSFLRGRFEDLGFFVKTGHIEDAFRETTLDVRPWRWIVVQGSVALRELAHLERFPQVSDRVLFVTGGLASELEKIRCFCDEIIETPLPQDDLARILGAPQRP